MGLKGQVEPDPGYKLLSGDRERGTKEGKV
jgi:hypothetical protein